MEDDLKSIKISYDLATLFRVLPWALFQGDQRNPQLLVKAALNESREFIEANIADPTRDRKSLMRGLVYNFMQSMGANVDPASVELIVSLVSDQVDEVTSTLYDDDLNGEKA